MFIRTERSLKEFIYAYPIVTSLVIINVSLWLIIYVLPFEFGTHILQLGVGHNYLIYEFDEYWRFITPVFLHSRDLMHVLFNCISLILFGPALEQMLGRFKFIVAYLLMGIAGNVGTYVVDLVKIMNSSIFFPASFTSHFGASGAIYGLFGMYMFMVFFRKSLIDRMNAQIVLTIFFIGLIMTFIMPGINISAHVFGFIGGFVIAPLFLVNAQPFSIYRNRRPPTRSGPGGVQFDPKRWEKRRFIPEVIRRNKVWIIFGIIVLIIVLSGM